MKEMMRSLFGLGSSRKRTVVGKKVSIDIRHVEYIKSSAARLSALHHLCKRYSNTAYEAKMKLVLEKTKTIHAYLMSRDRLHELELFHLQNTDHFISTYTVIMDAYQQRTDPNFVFTKFEPQPEPMLSQAEPERIKRKARPASAVEMVRLPQGNAAFLNGEISRNDVPSLSVPEISINTFVKIPYSTETNGNGFGYEIGFTSTPLEKENFLRHVAAQLGISNLTYVGNALVNIPNSKGNNPTGMVPIIHWEDFLYALNLNDYRLFPVRIFRKS